MPVVVSRIKQVGGLLLNHGPHRRFLIAGARPFKIWKALLDLCGKRCKHQLVHFVAEGMDEAVVHTVRRGFVTPIGSELTH
jgi:hypothetical protein